MTMDVTVDASCGKLVLHADASVARTKADGTSVTCIDRDGAALYYANSALYLENGKSYAVGGAFPDLSLIHICICRKLDCSLGDIVQIAPSEAPIKNGLERRKKRTQSREKGGSSLYHE